ncbi:DUF4381 family protein [Pseudomonas citronellolis]|uniref:DUF4381 family protein n=1 Tax=Pseudomonas citronellolis TaxID=53408 RepID=UPI0023E3C3BF|nr:DUF4381 family protein [Pseudomonas citronellolis]MDF3935575.1 DUF4381 family protein [Pseudomonas citronellolis]
MSAPSRNDIPGIELPDLAELSPPAPVSLFPQTLAWKLLFAALVLALLAYLLLRYRRYRRRRWRRQAQALARVARAEASGDAWFALIKRVCLVHQSRERVAGLSDSATLDQLDGLDESTRQALLDRHHRREARLEPAANAAVAETFARWLQELPDVR